MKQLALMSALGLALATTASASNFSLSGPGGAIPDSVVAGTWATQVYTDTPLTTTIVVPNAVTSLTSVKLSGLNHTWRGDLHIFLHAPGGNNYNLVVRPGFTGTGFGDSGDYLVGDFVFVDAGGGTVGQGATNISPGNYNLYPNTGAGQWTNATWFNAALSSITAPAGTWTLEIRDWGAGDVGSITGWTLNGTDNTGSGPVAFCDPGVGGVASCPCVNPPSGTGRGCNNSAATGGASITAAGTSSLAGDTLVFTTANQTATGTTIVMQGNGQVLAGVTFGQGVRCVGGALYRLYLKTTTTGSITAPSGGDPTLSVRSSAAGDTIAAGTHRYYMAYYRDSTVLGGCPATSMFNGTNALDVTWTP